MSPANLLLLCVFYVMLALVRSSPVAFIRPVSSQESVELDDRGDDRDFIVYAPSRTDSASQEFIGDDWRNTKAYRPVTIRSKKDKLNAGQIAVLLSNIARDRGVTNGKMKGIRFGVSK